MTTKLDKYLQNQDYKISGITLKANTILSPEACEEQILATIQEFEKNPPQPVEIGKVFDKFNKR